MTINFRRTALTASNPAALALGTAQLLRVGGDSRLQPVDSPLSDGVLNRYGTGSAPRSALAFGSCTASSPLPRVYAAATKQHELLRRAASAGVIESAIRDSYAQIASDMARYLYVDKVGGTSIALAPSGTDAEFLAVLLALRDRSRPLCNVVVGPAEVGRGTAYAAAGRHFDNVASHAPAVPAGDAVCESIADLIDLMTVDLRDRTGEVKTPEELDDETEAIVAQAIGRGRRVLLHIVAHSKTGVHAPTLGTVRKLRRRYPEDVDVVVDAAQGRISRRGLVEALQEGHLVLFTGSKFYGGPSFSGALLVPKELDPVALGTPPIPREFSSYFSRWELPPAWVSFGAELEHDYNLGLLLRWVAATEATRAYYTVPDAARFAILRRFEDMVPQLLSQSKWIKLDSVEPQHFPPGVERLLESKTTVFPFSVRSQQRSDALNGAELLRVAEWMNRDLRYAARELGALNQAGGASRSSRAGRSGPRASRLAAPSITAQQMLKTAFHLGQPVAHQCDQPRAVLRIALGAALVTQVGLDPACGASFEERLAWLETHVRMALAKAEWVAEQFPFLAAFAKHAPVDGGIPSMDRALTSLGVT